MKKINNVRELQDFIDKVVAELKANPLYKSRIKYVTVEKQNTLNDALKFEGRVELWANDKFEYLLESGVYCCRNFLKANSWISTHILDNLELSDTIDFADCCFQIE